MVKKFNKDARYRANGEITISGRQKVTTFKAGDEVPQSVIEANTDLLDLMVTDAGGAKPLIEVIEVK